MDPLSDVLSLLKPRSYVSGGFDVGGDWSIQFPRHEGIKCYALVSGACWLAVDDVSEAVRLEAGDCFLLPTGRPFRLTTDLALPSIDARTLFAAVRDGVRAINGGGEVFIAGSHFLLDGEQARVLLNGLPPIVHVREEAQRETLRWSMARLGQELRERQPGGVLMAQHLAHMMLVQALRLHLAEGAKDGVGWLFALADKSMSAAIGAMHQDPAQRWTLQSLAERVGMSRSSFAQRFKVTVGTSPMDYLTRWRMLLAGDRLTHSSDPVSAIALSLGYESESAFSTAFRRVMGCSPRRYGRDCSTVSGNAERHPAPDAVAA
jgi:AraC-like DNA-binding protein